MKFNIILFAFLLLSTFIFAQSKADTQDWIKDKIEQYHYKAKYDFHNYDVKFDNGFMIIFSPIGSKLSYEKIPLKQINQFNIDYFKAEEREGYVIELKCNLSDKCVETGTYINDAYICDNNKRSASNGIYLDIAFKNDNLPERMKKALKHLIELNGGKVKDEPF